MSIKHTSSERYMVYSYLPCKGKLYKGVKRWAFHKGYATKQGALKAIERIKEKNKDSEIESRLIFKVVWSPNPFASDEKCVTVYNEDYEVEG